MQRSRRLEPVVRVADRRQQAAAERFQASRARLDGFRARLTEMRAYRLEYMNGFNAKGRSEGLTGQGVKAYQAFMAKLDDGIEQLEELVRNAAFTCEQHKVVWLTRRARTRALGQVVDRHRQAEELELLRAEERESDERSQRRRS